MRAITSQPSAAVRCDHRSTRAPAGRPSTSHGSHSAASSRPSAAAEAPSRVTATDGKLTAPMDVPSALVAPPSQSRRKDGTARSRRGAEAARAAVAGSGFGGSWPYRLHRLRYRREIRSAT